MQRHGTMCEVGDKGRQILRDLITQCEAEWWLCKGGGGSHEDPKWTEDRHVFNTRKANCQSLAAQPLLLNPNLCACTSLQDISTL